MSDKSMETKMLKRKATGTPGRSTEKRVQTKRTLTQPTGSNQFRKLHLTNLCLGLLLRLNPQVKKLWKKIEGSLKEVCLGRETEMRKIYPRDQSMREKV